jgi:hypothetical protein
MKVFGKKSISSVLEVSLAVAWYLCIALMVGALWTCAVLILMDQQKLLEALSHRSGFAFPLNSDLVRIELPAKALKSPHVLAGFLALGFVKLGFALAVIHQLKRIFRTLHAGLIFKDENARRIRTIGLITLGGAIANTLASYFIGSFIAADLGIVGANVSPILHLNIEGLFAGFVLIVLAEIFRHGTALQAEQDLTV